MDVLKAKAVKFLKGAAIAAAGAIIGYVSTNIIPDLEVSGASATTIAVLSAAINLIKVAFQKVQPAEVR